MITIVKLIEHDLKRTNLKSSSPDLEQLSEVSQMGENNSNVVTIVHLSHECY